MHPKHCQTLCGNHITVFGQEVGVTIRRLSTLPGRQGTGQHVIGSEAQVRGDGDEEVWQVVLLSQLLQMAHSTTDPLQTLLMGKLATMEINAKEGPCASCATRWSTQE